MAARHATSVEDVIMASASGPTRCSSPCHHPWLSRSGSTLTTKWPWDCSSSSSTSGGDAHPGTWSQSRNAGLAQRICQLIGVKVAMRSGVSSAIVSRSRARSLEMCTGAGCASTPGSAAGAGTTSVDAGAGAASASSSVTGRTTTPSGPLRTSKRVVARRSSPSRTVVTAEKSGLA